MFNECKNHQRNKQNVNICWCIQYKEKQERDNIQITLKLSQNINNYCLSVW